jgi:PAS domain S-box-containing protein
VRMSSIHDRLPRSTFSVDSPLRTAGWLILVAALSYLAAKLGGTVVLRPQVNWPLWPGNVLLVSILLLVPRRIWPILMAAAFAAFAIYDLQSGVTIRSTALLILSDLVEVLTAAWGLSYAFGETPHLDSVKALAKYAFFAVFLAPFTAAFFGARASSGNYWTSWRISFFSEALAFLTLLPAILGWVSKRTSWVRESFAYHLEEGALFVGLVLLGYFTFVSAWSIIAPALPFVPLLLWAALRFGPTGVSSAMVVLVFLSIGGAINGRGPFVEVGPPKNIIPLQVFLLFAAAPFMLLAALVEERKQAEQARSKLASIVESSDDGIMSEDIDGIIVSWNRGAERIFGFSQAEAVGQPVTALIPPETREEEKTILQRATAGETVEHYETIRVTKEGKKIHVSLTVSPLRDARSWIVGASTIARDITEHNRAREELKKSEERFSKAFRHSPMALSLVSAKTHRYLDINETYERIWGYTRSDVIGKNAIELRLWVNPAERDRLNLKLELEGSLREAECEWRTKDGRILIALASVEFIEIDGEPCFIAVVSDITDRKRTEHALLESERRFRLMANTAPVMIWTSALDKQRDYFNQPWLEFTGRRLAAELGNGWTEAVHPDDLAAWLDTYTKAFDACQPFEMQYRLRRHNGEYRWVLDAGVPRFSGDNSFAGYIGSCIDITDRKLAEEALSAVGRRLMEAQEEERKRIARELHDDINQRLALLANGLQEFEQATLANNNPLQDKTLHKLWHLTNEIATDIQHISHQLHPSKLHYLGLAATVRDLCHEFSAQHKIEVECVVRDLPGNLEENKSLNVFRVVQESLRNVVKHSHARHVKVELTCQSSMVQLRVSDDGVGFNPEDVRHKHGLGLVSMRERLRSVDGEFSIWSKPSLGTQVEGRVPATRKLVRKAEEPAAD